MVLVRVLSAAAIAWIAGASSRAEAFSVSVHMYLANSIHDELARNLEVTGRPMLRILTPDGRTVRIEVDAVDARAILDYPEYFRGGAIGPDNTVFTGLTDPSHAWQFRPFAQCEALLEEARAQEERVLATGVDPADVPKAERAYALGCFLHGVTDNAAHHTVNFFSGETFTLYPVDAAESGMLEFSLLNVVRHIVVESRFQRSLEAEDASFGDLERRRAGIMQSALDPDALEHRIATDLMARVYFDQGDGGPTDLWTDFVGDRLEQKRARLRLGLGLGEGEDVAAALIASDDPWADDLRAVEAYVLFLTSSGMAPADYVLFMPELIRDVRRLYEIADMQGRRQAQEISPILRPISYRLLNNAFAPRNADDDPDWTATGQSRFQMVMAQKFAEFDGVLPAFLETIENISNLNTTVGIVEATPEQRAAAIQPLRDRIAAITDIQWEILFSETTLALLEEVQSVRDAIQQITTLVKERIREFVLERVQQYLDLLASEARALLGEVDAYLDMKLADSIDELRVRVSELEASAPDEASREAYANLRQSLEVGGGPFASLLDSVLYMNAYNSAAGVIARHDAVIAPGSAMFDGPVSFDASYQLEYNQLALCPELRAAFYPCGTSAGEMLQADFRNCVPVPEVPAALEPPVECHGGNATMFTIPSQASCMGVTLDAIRTTAAPLGSYTLAFPPTSDALGDAAPSCRLSGLELETDDTNPPDGGVLGDGSITRAPPASGCGCSADEPRGLLPVIAIGLLTLGRRRRR
jgi:MYXO-CTERM domain-containing protein